jgi:hypothetical protein
MTRHVGASAALLLILGIAGLAAGDQKKSDRGVLPGKATWDVRAFNITFKVVSTAYDASTKQVTWVLETKEGMRTSDFQRELDRTRPYVFKFLDADMDEVATVRLGSAHFKGIPKDRVMKEGTRLEVVLDLPDAFDRAQKVILQRGTGD